MSVVKNSFNKVKNWWNFTPTRSYAPKPNPYAGDNDSQDRERRAENKKKGH